MKKLGLLLLIPLLLAGCTTTTKTNDAAKIKELENQIEVLETNNNLETTELSEITTSTDQLTTATTSKSSFRPIEAPKTTATQESSKTTTATTSSFRVLRPAQPQIIEKDFRNNLIALYTDKLSYLSMKIGLLDVSKGMHEWDADEERKSIAFAEKIQNESGYNTSFGKSIWQAELAEDLKLIEAYAKLIGQLQSTEKWLEAELNAAKTNTTAITEAEYKLRENILLLYVNQNDITKASDSIYNSIYFTYDKRAELYDEIVAAAKKDIAILNNEIASLQAEINSMPTITPPKISTPTSITPTNIQCTTRHSSNTFKTTCIEIPTMRSYVCNSSYDSFWKTTTNCYYQ